MKRICEYCANWTEKYFVRDGREIKDLRFCPVLGARGTYTTHKCYCQYWKPAKFRLIQIGDLVNEDKTR